MKNPSEQDKEQDLVILSEYNPKGHLLTHFIVENRAK